MSLPVPRRKAAALALAATGLATVLAGAFAPTAQAASAPSAERAAAKASDWFKDPRTPAQRKAQVAVPKKPGAYKGKVKETRAVYRTKAGSLAVPMRYAFGNTVAKGQAVTLDGNGLFVVNTTVLTASAKTQIHKLAVALENASSVRCEGYADYAGAAQRNNVLARDRAARVCDFLVSANKGLTATTVSYGPTWPAVIGGDSEARKLNRRVVVEMTGTKPVAPQAQVPGPPVLEHVNGYGTSAYFAWSAPLDDGGSPVTGYQITTGAGWAPVNLQLPRVAKNSLCRGDCGDFLYGFVEDLTPGSTVALRVRAVNAIGAGTPSNTLSTVVYDVPGAPTGLDYVTQDGDLAVHFGAPATTGGLPVTGYQISYDGGLHYDDLELSGPGPWTVVEHDLAIGDTYAVRVRAGNDYGWGEPAAVDALITAKPSAPWIDEPELDGTTASFVFEKPDSDGGLPLTGYRITTDGGLTWAPLTVQETAEGLTFALTGLELGHEYVVQVRAVNARGEGALSKTRTFTPALVPSAPTALGVTSGDGEVTVTFGAPQHDNGAEVTSYDVSFDGGESWWYAVELDGQAPWSFTMDGFVNGHSYDVRVRASNRVGHGPSAVQDDVLVATTPGVPTVYGLQPADAAATLMFGAPGSDGGAAVTSYEVSLDGGPWTAVTVTQHPLNPAIRQATLTGLDNGHEYAVRVRAVNARGAGGSTEAVAVTPSTVPKAPTGLTAVVDGTTVTLTFDAPSDGGSAITGYQVRVDGGLWTAAAEVEGTITLTDQVAGVHTYAVRAVNANGSSTPATSDEVEVVQPPAGAPTDVYVFGDGNNGTMQTYWVQWKPGATYGRTVTGWQAQVDDGSWVDIVDIEEFEGSVYSSFQVPCGGACGRTYTVIHIRGVLAGGGYTLVGDTPPGPGPGSGEEEEPVGPGIPGGDPR